MANNGSLSYSKSVNQIAYKEEDILALNVKGSCVFENERRSV